MGRIRWAMAVAGCLAVTAAQAASEPEARPAGWRFAVSPMAGYDRNEVYPRHPGGESMTDTGWMGGLYALAFHPQWAVNNFLFFSDVNDSDVWGNLFFANYYATPKVPVTWNAGVGHLYHGIETARSDVTVQMPLVKAGPVFRVGALRLMLNPYLGYGWERTSVSPGGSETEGSVLYGLTLNWRWRMLEVGVNYYYQDPEDGDEGYNVVRARLVGMFSEQWGLAARVDYQEHRGSDDLFVLAGPVWLF